VNAHNQSYAYWFLGIMFVSMNAIMYGLILELDI